MSKSSLLRKELDSKTKVIKPGLAHLPKFGWVRSVREALGMTQKDLANRLGVNQKTIHVFEANEIDRKIQLDTLEKLADAMGCDLYYAFVPRQTLEEFYVAQSLKAAKAADDEVRNNMELEAQPVKSSAKRIELAAHRMVINDAVKWNV